MPENEGISRWSPWRKATGAPRSAPAQCANRECARRQPMWNGLFGKMQGVETNLGWFCCPDCFEQALSSSLAQHLRRSKRVETPSLHRMPLGLLMLERETITEDQLQKSVAMMKATGLRIGDCMRRIAGLNEDAVTQAVAAQWGAPVFPLTSIDASLAGMIPLALLEKYQMLPVHLGQYGKKMYVGFCQGVDYSALYGIEQLMDCTTEACIIAGSSWTEVIEERQSGAGWSDVVVESRATTAEIARMTRSYAQQLEARTIRFAAVGDYLWARILGRSSLNLLYHRHSNGRNDVDELKVDPR